MSLRFVIQIQVLALDSIDGHKNIGIPLCFLVERGFEITDDLVFQVTIGFGNDLPQAALEVVLNLIQFLRKNETSRQDLRCT